MPRIWQSIITFETVKMINIPIDHDFTYRQLYRWLNEIDERNGTGFRFGFILYNPLQH